MNTEKSPKLDRSEVIEDLPLACSDERAAVEFMEAQRWGGSPSCPRCDDTNVYRMSEDVKPGKKPRFLWRCRGCKKQYTVRVGTVFEDSKIELRHWCFAFWQAATAKKGVSALQIKRQTQLTYKSALFMMHRIRFALDGGDGPKLSGKVEVDETYVGGKPRYKRHGDGRGMKKGDLDKKAQIVALVQRGGNVKALVRDRITAHDLGKFKQIIRDRVEKSAMIYTDEAQRYVGIGREFAGHESVNHKRHEYVRGDATTNTIEGFFSLIKRGIYGTYHSVSKHHLHRYVAEFEFRYNHRDECDGDRVTAAIRGAEGKRLLYQTPA